MKTERRWWDAGWPDFGWIQKIFFLVAVYRSVYFSCPSKCWNAFISNWFPSIENKLTCESANNRVGIPSIVNRLWSNRNIFNRGQSAIRSGKASTKFWFKLTSDTFNGGQSPGMPVIWFSLRSMVSRFLAFENWTGNDRNRFRAMLTLRKATNWFNVSGNSSNWLSFKINDSNLISLPNSGGNSLSWLLFKIKCLKLIRSPITSGILFILLNDRSRLRMTALSWRMARGKQLTFALLSVKTPVRSAFCTCFLNVAWLPMFWERRVRPYSDITWSVRVWCVSGWICWKEKRGKALNKTLSTNVSSVWRFGWI